MPSLLWQGTGLTDTGLVRKSNQDTFAIENSLGLWVIADGMGGHAGGQIASELVVSAIVDYIGTAKQEQAQDHYATSTMLSEAVIAGNQAIHQRVKSSPDLTGMGTTVVATLFCPTPSPSVIIAHVGDSRAYRIRDRQMEALTVDHSLVQGLVSDGQITQEQANTHPKQNVLLRALGATDEEHPDVEIHPLKPHDVLLLCTDGLTKAISEDEILAIVLEPGSSSERICEQLIKHANEGGGKDNTTVALVTPQLIDRTRVMTIPKFVRADD